MHGSASLDSCLSHSANYLTDPKPIERSSMRRIILLASLGLLLPIHACQEAPQLSEPVGAPAAASVAAGSLVVSGDGTCCTPTGSETDARVGATCC